MWSHSRAIAAGVVLILFALLGPAAAEPHRVLLLHSFGPHFSPWNAISSRFREALLEQSRIAIDLYEASLHSRRLGETHDERSFIEYLHALFAERHLELVVAMGAPAGRFFLEHRSEISPSTPLLVTGADERALNGAVLTANDAAVTVLFDQAKQIENILQLLPDTTTIAVATGALSRLHQAANSPIFSFIDSNFGHGTVGGPLVSTEKIARHSANVVV